MTTPVWWRRPSLWRYLTVGMTVVVVDFGLLTVLHAWWGVNVVVASVVAFMAAFGVNFGLNRGWTFQASGQPAPGQLVRFTILVAANTLVTAVGMGGLTALGLNFLVAKLLITAVIVSVNYVVMRRWVFRPDSPLTSTGSPPTSTSR